MIDFKQALMGVCILLCFAFGIMLHNQSKMAVKQAVLESRLDNLNTDGLDTLSVQIRNMDRNVGTALLQINGRLRDQEIYRTLFEQTFLRVDSSSYLTIARAIGEQLARDTTNQSTPNQ